MMKILLLNNSYWLFKRSSYPMYLGREKNYKIPSVNFILKCERAFLNSKKEIEVYREKSALERFSINGHREISTEIQMKLLRSSEKRRRENNMLILKYYIYFRHLKNNLFVRNEN